MTLGDVAVPLLVGGITIAAVLWRLRVVVPPGHIAVISGRSHVTPDGETRGYRIVMRRSTMRMPLVERCDLLSVGPFSVEATMRNLHTKGGGRAHIRMCARLTIPRDYGVAVRAVERFVGRGDAEIITVGRETLEGVWRGVAATLTTRELREDRATVGSAIMGKAQPELEGLGLTMQSLDTFEVTDAESPA